ncbi:MAG: ArsR family transcriptional regulator [Desulfurococcales archaeon]|nr:ArsR family transcriptional regulator [Desulfurococcales archaeon]
MAGEHGFEDKESITKNLKVVYEDPEIIVYTAPTEEELKEILLDLLEKHERMSIRDLHQFLSGLASEDKIRYALSRLMEENLVAVDKDGYYYIAPAVYDDYYMGEENYY